MTESYIELFIKKVNEYYTCYYEEVPKNAKFPYLVIPTINLTCLESGYLCLTDIYVYNNELSDISIEKICDDLRTNLDGYSTLDENKKIGFHVNFENQTIMNTNEQDLILRKIGFASRIFEIV